MNDSAVESADRASRVRPNRDAPAVRDGTGTDICGTHAQHCPSNTFSIKNQAIHDIVWTDTVAGTAKCAAVSANRDPVLYNYANGKC